MWLRCELSVGLAVAAVLGCEAAAADTLVLRDEAYVKGPQVLLGDVADIDGELAPVLKEIDLGTAALPGDSKRLNAALVESRIRNAGVDVASLEVKGAPTVRATTMHLEINGDMLANSLREFIEASMPWDPANTEIDILPGVADFRVPDGEVVFDWQANPQYRYLGQGAFRGAVIVDGQAQKRFTMKAAIESYGDIVVARTDIPRGQILSPNLLEVRKRALSRIEAGAFADPAEVDGCVTRTSIFSGQELTSRKVQPRILVKRNQLVAVEMHAGALRVQSQARAMVPGAAGDVILCQNLTSKQEFQAIVRKDGVVVVQ